MTINKRSYPIGKILPSPQTEESAILQRRGIPESDPSPISGVKASLRGEIEQARVSGIHSTRTSVKDLFDLHPELENQLPFIRAFIDMAGAATTSEARKDFFIKLNKWLENPYSAHSLAFLLARRLVVHQEEDWRILLQSVDEFYGENAKLTLVRLDDNETVEVPMVDIFAGLEI